jgi:predicted AAA+ superfamily ATPase
MHRRLEPFIKKDLENKMVLLSGPRQVGKTTLSKQLGGATSYLNYDSGIHRKILFNQTWDRSCQIIVFDELHKMRRWKSWLKGVFDTEKRPPAIRKSLDL